MRSSKPTCDLVSKVNFISLLLQVVFMNLSKADEFVKALNKVCGCRTPECEEELAPIKVRSIGLGGALSVAYVCSGCALQHVVLETS